jgi:hypothetical protein
VGNRFVSFRLIAQLVSASANYSAKPCKSKLHLALAPTWSNGKPVAKKSIGRRMRLEDHLQKMIEVIDRLIIQLVQEKEISR